MAPRAAPCPPDKPYRSPKDGKCYRGHTTASRQAGVCPPKWNERAGKMTEYVYAFRNGKHRCLKAGGATAKQHLGEKGCPAGKVLASVPVTLPDGRRTKGRRCVAPRGDYADLKKCPVGQVLASKRRSGVAPDGSRWSKVVSVCVKADTARAKGYAIKAQGTNTTARTHITKPKAVRTGSTDTGRTNAFGYPIFERASGTEYVTIAGKRRAPAKTARSKARQLQHHRF